MKFLKILLIIIIFIFIFKISKTLLINPPIWPDEAIYADIVNNYLKEHRLGTDLWKGTIPGIENYALWYPPVFFYLLTYWFKFFGLSIFNQRLLSVIVGCCFLLIYLLFIKQFFKKKHYWFSFISFGFLTIDPIFVQSIKVSRPEIFVLFFGIFSWYLFLKAFAKKLSLTKQYYLYIGSGLLASLALLTHLLGSFFFLTIIICFLLTHSMKTFLRKDFYLTIAFFVLPIFVWLLSIFPHLEILQKQLSIVSLRKSFELPWIYLVFQTQPLLIKLQYFTYIVITGLFIIFVKTRINSPLLFLKVALITSWLFSTFGKMFWYFVFPIPFVYLAFNIFLLKKCFNKKKLLLDLIVVLLIFFHFYLFFHLIFFNKNKIPSYNKFVEVVLEKIPENKTVFLSSIPDVYYGFKINNRNNKLYEFPVVQTPIENYLRLLSDSDYVIFNGSYEKLVFGNFLEDYLASNQQEIYFVGEPDQYQTFVIKLKAKNQRSPLF